MTLYPDPFSDGWIDAEHPFDPDLHGLRHADAAYWEAAAKLTAAEPVVCAGSGVPIEECPVCGPELVTAMAMDILDEEAA